MARLINLVDLSNINNRLKPISQYLPYECADITNDLSSYQNLLAIRFLWLYIGSVLKTNLLLPDVDIKELVDEDGAIDYAVDVINESSFNAIFNSYDWESMVAYFDAPLTTSNLYEAFNTTDEDFFSFIDKYSICDEYVVVLKNRKLFDFLQKHPEYRDDIYNLLYSSYFGYCGYGIFKADKNLPDGGPMDGKEHTILETKENLYYAMAVGEFFEDCTFSFEPMTYFTAYAIDKFISQYD